MLVKKNLVFPQLTCYSEDVHHIEEAIRQSDLGAYERTIANSDLSRSNQASNCSDLNCFLQKSLKFLRENY